MLSPLKNFHFLILFCIFFHLVRNSQNNKYSLKSHRKQPTIINRSQMSNQFIFNLIDLAYNLFLPSDCLILHLLKRLHWLLFIDRVQLVIFLQHLKPFARSITHEFVRLQNELFNYLLADSFMLSNLQLQWFLFQMLHFRWLFLWKFARTQNKNVHFFVFWFVNTLVSRPVKVKNFLRSFANRLNIWTLFELFVSTETKREIF